MEEELEAMNVVGEGGSFEKDLRLTDRELDIQRRGRNYRRNDQRM